MHSLQHSTPSIKLDHGKDKINILIKIFVFDTFLTLSKFLHADNYNDSNLAIVLNSTFIIMEYNNIPRVASQVLSPGLVSSYHTSHHLSLLNLKWL